VRIIKANTNLVIVAAPRQRNKSQIRGGT